MMARVSHPHKDINGIKPDARFVLSDGYV